MALSIPSTRPHIEEAIEQDLAIFTRSLEAQAQRLIVYPLQQAKALNPDIFASDTLPHLILIDGLDECADDVVQSRILDLFCGIIGQQDAIPFIVFIASRPERHIRSMFDCGDLNHLTTRIGLDSSFQPDADIRLFLTEKFDEIKSTHPFKRLIPNPDLWPSKEVIDMLIEKSSGQFIFPSTVSKYLQSRRHRPDERLKIICGISRSANEAPYAALDALYIHIFSSAMDIASALRIIALKLTGDGVVLHYPYKANPYSDNYLSVYSERVERFLSFGPGTMEYCMADLESIIAVGAPYNPVGFFHASLSDFLLDHSRSGEYHIDIAAAHAEFSICHLRHLEAEQPRFGSQMFINSWEGLLHNVSPAEPTPELRQEIEGLKNSMAVIDCYVHARKHDHISAHSFDKLLTAICSSKFPDARELSEEIRLAFDEYQKSKPSSVES
ncbi:hypothetical protein BDZ97DRAFT_1175877 [Flammula alnicola]|nr:hypothetical protein BDZ97DRAFT_1175877 [Flammula alnicola]